MSTPAQIVANQHNAALSTGPSTPAGKAVASQNAVKHGLSGAFSVLPHENQQDFDSLLASYRERFTPRDQHEEFLIERMLESRWKLSRLKRMEAALIEQMTSEDTSHSNPDAVVAAAMLHGKGNAYAALQRYAAAAERSYYKAKLELEHERSRTLKVVPPPPVQNEPKPAPRPSANLLDYVGNNLKKLGQLSKPVSKTNYW